ncbi:ATP-binding protein [Pedobacter sp. NJ-S-72]
MKKGITPAELDSIKFDVFEFEGEWYEAYDHPETNGVWFIWGDSGNGKTSVTLKLVKYLTTFKKKVIYNSLEEGRRKTMQDAFRKANMKEVNGKFIMVQESMAELTVRLKKRGSAEIVVIDSIQYANMTFLQYRAWRKLHPTKLIIILSQVTGKQPKGQMAKDVMSDADLKIWVEGHRAISKGRFIGTKGYYTNWIEGAFKYWGS